MLQGGGKIMDIIVKRGEMERHQMEKNIAKPAALARLKEMSSQEKIKSTDNWWKKRVDWSNARKNAKKYQDNLDKVTPEKLMPGVKNMMWKRAKQLKDQFSVGMLSKEELHPVKGFKENGKMVWVVDEEKMRALNSVERNRAWYKDNEAKVREFKNIMRHLCPENANAGDIEKFRPKLKNIR